MSTPSKQTASESSGAILMVGRGDPLDLALRTALVRQGLTVQAIPLAWLRDSVIKTAPDLVLLIGDAAKEGGKAAIAQLGSGQRTATVPVVLLAPDGVPDHKLDAFRHGAMAVLPRSSSADEVAKRVLELTTELSTHFEEKTGEIGEATLDELVAYVKKERRSGILSVHAPGHQGGPIRVVLGAGRSVDEAVEEFVARVGPHASAEAMYYQFHPAAGGTVELLDLEPSGEAVSEGLKDLRLLVVDNDPERANTLAKALRERGALVWVTDEAGQGLERAFGLDPQVAIVDQEGLEGPGFEVIRQIRHDLRMRWASILVAPWSEIWPKGADSPDIGALAAKIEPLLASERDLRARSVEGEAFDVRLESTGPCRMLRLLVDSGSTLHVTVRNPKVTVEVDVAQGLIVGAQAELRPSGGAEGPAALSALLALGSGRVHVEPRDHPASANIMSPVDEALSLASSEPSPVKPSRPPLSDKFAPISEEESEEESSTRVKDLGGLAKSAEVLLDRKPVPKPKIPPPKKRRKATLVMGAPVVSVGGEPKPPPPLPSKAGAPPPEPPARDADPFDRPTVRPEAIGLEELPDSLPPDIPDAPPVGIDDIAAHASPQQPGASPVDLGGDSEGAEPRQTTPGVAPPPPSRAIPPAGPAAPSLDAPFAPPAEPASAPEAEPAAAAEAPAAPAEEAPAPTPTPTPIAAPEPTPAAEPAAPPEAAAASAAAAPPAPAPGTEAAAPAPAAPLPEAAQPPERGGGGRKGLLALGVVLVLVALPVLAVVGYLASGMHQPQVDSLLASLGIGAAPAPDAPEDTPEVEPEAPTPEPEAPTPEPEPEPEVTPQTEPVAETEGEAEVVAEGEAEGELEGEAEGEGETEGEAEGEGEVVAEGETEGEPEGEGEEQAVPDPNDPDELLRRARQAGDTDMAVTLYRRVLELDSREHHAMVGLARTLLSRNERPSEAVQLMRSAVQRRPRRASYQVLLGDALRASGDAAGAQAAYRRALELDPDDRLARHRLGQ